MVYRKDDGENQIFFIGLWYRDKLVRTEKGWRIKERREEMAYAYNTPEMPAAPALAQVD